MEDACESCLAVCLSVTSAARTSQFAPQSRRFFYSYTITTLTAYACRYFCNITTAHQPDLSFNTTPAYTTKTLPLRGRSAVREYGVRAEVSRILLPRPLTFADVQ